MPIRIKLLLLVICLGAVLTVNLATLGFLAAAMTTSQQRIAEASSQQIATAQMQTSLRDAEAALYRYLIEGEPGFADQFAQQLALFKAQIADYEAQAQTNQEKVWATTLLTTHQQAAEIGAELIALRDNQRQNLDQLENNKRILDTLLAEIATTNPAYLQPANGMGDQLQALSLAVTSYLTAPKEPESVQFTESVINFQSHYHQFQALATSPQTQSWAREIERLFANIRRLGIDLINNREEQQIQFANFAALLFQGGEKVLAGQIQPFADQTMLTTQTELQTTLKQSILFSLLFGLLISIIAALIALPLFQQMNNGIHNLLQGAARVASGNLAQPIQSQTQDELGQLSQAFNQMMGDLSGREAGLKARLSELETLRQVSLQLTSTLNPAQLLDTIAQSALTLAQASEVRIFVASPPDGNLTFATNAQKDQTAPGLPKKPRPTGLVVMAARLGQPQLIAEANQHPLFDTPEARQWGVKAAGAFPLKLEERVLGVLHVSYATANTFNEDNLRVLGLLADQAAIALENAALYQNLADRETRLHILAQKLVHVQEEERRLIGLDLHDGLTQLLLSANMHLNTLGALAAGGLGEQGKMELKLGQTRLQEAINEARQVVSELRPTALEERGLVGGLRYYATEVSQRAHWQLEFLAQLGEVRLNSAIETAIFRIAQEALTNARKYAQTQRVRVALQLDGVDGDRLRLEVQDWGIGFDLAQIAEERQGLGLVGMRERAALLNGVCEIKSQPNQGTHVLVAIPV